MKISRAKGFIAIRLGGATVTGEARDGVPTVRYETAEIRSGEFFVLPDDQARELVAKGLAEEATLEGAAHTLVEAVLGLADPLAAALAGFGVPYIAVRHAEWQSGHLMPALSSAGPTHSGADGFFGSEAEIEAFWTAHPNATPVFSFETEHGYRRSYAWRAGTLAEIAHMLAHGHIAFPSSEAVDFAIGQAKGLI